MKIQNFVNYSLNKFYFSSGILISCLFTLNQPSLALTINETINEFGFLTTSSSASAFFSFFTDSDDPLDPIGTFDADSFNWTFEGIFDNEPINISYTGSRTELDTNTQLLSWTGTGTYQGFTYSATGSTEFSLVSINGLDVFFNSEETNNLLLSQNGNFFEQSYTLQGNGNLTLVSLPETVNTNEIVAFLGGGSAEAEVSAGEQQQVGTGQQNGVNQAGVANVNVPINLQIQTIKEPERENQTQDRTTSTPSTTTIEGKEVIQNPNGTFTARDGKVVIQRKIPESTSTFGLLTLGILGSVSILKRKNSALTALTKFGNNKLQHQGQAGN